ncbi:MAG TPA: hypothetical protein PK007_09835 [Candidatus Kapabacteria bacterium]|nr:hypothetical protein [Candidatus Kapabacteria bacterium]HPP39679.1 hypothetical protein [Candidatus Kapabacteria bacterium]
MKLLKLIILSFTIIIFYACTETIGTNSKDIIFPEENVSFQFHVYPFLKLNCSYAGCHSDESAAGGIILTSYSTLFASPGMIIIGEPDKSRLIQIIENKLPHFTLFYRGNITENNKKGMRTWILEGAKNN